MYFISFFLNILSNKKNMIIYKLIYNYKNIVSKKLIIQKIKDFLLIHHIYYIILQY